MNASASASAPTPGAGATAASGATLTDRYIWAVVRALPEAQRAEWTGRGKVVNIVAAIAVGAVAAWRIVDGWITFAASRRQG